MKYDNEDVLIFALGFLQENKDKKVLTRAELAESIGISLSTFNRCVNRLIQKGLVKRKQKLKGVCRYGLSSRGINYYERISSKIYNIILTPEQHNVSMICSINPIIESIKDPTIIFKIISFSIKGIELNVPGLLQKYSCFNSDGRFQGYLDEVLSREQPDYETNPEEFVKSVTQLGLEPGDVNNRMNNPDRYKSALSTAEYKLRSGNLDDAISLYTSILSTDKGLDQNVWIVAYTRYMRCLMGKGEHGKVISMAEEIDPLIRNCIHKAMIKQEHATSLSFKKKYGQAKKLYDYSLRVFENENLPILQTSLRNNLGVLHYRRNQFSLAEKQWLMAERIAKKNNILWMKAILCMNLGDLISHNKGQTRRGKERVRRARKIMESLNDMEGIADAQFNYSLVCIDEGNIKLANKYFIRSLEFPIIDEAKRNERVEVFEGRLKEGRK